jgi:restriction system protein
MWSVEEELRIDISADDLRKIVENAISSTIDVHRSSRAELRADLIEQDGDGDEPTDEEISDFIRSSSFLDEETIEQLTDPGLLGFYSRMARVSPEWLDEFRRNVAAWAAGPKWLSAQLEWFTSGRPFTPVETHLWIPGTSDRPFWLERSPSAVRLAADYLAGGRLLSELPWRTFEELIGELLERDGWLVEVMRGTRDGGIDVVSTRFDEAIGAIRAVWQAKRYAPNRKVKLSHVRELAGVLNDERATKGLIVTTSHLTRDALRWIRRDLYRLDHKEREAVESWVLRSAGRG